MQQAIIRDQLCHLQVMKPHSTEGLFILAWATLLSSPDIGLNSVDVGSNASFKLVSPN